MDYSGTYLKGKSNFIKMMLDTSLVGGNKLSMLKHYNHFHSNFYYFFSLGESGLVVIAIDCKSVCFKTIEGSNHSFLKKLII